SFTVQLEAQPTAPEAKCQDLAPTLDENGQISITAQEVYTGNQGNLKLSIDRENIDCSDLGPNSVVLTVTDPATGLSSTCTATVYIVDETPPSITCPYDQTENYDSAQGYVLPDYTSFAAVADNCGEPTVTQSPAPGTTINANTEITLTATDASGNFSSCSFKVLLSEEEVLQISCPGNKTASLNENCLFEVPDYRDMASVNIASAEISQSPEPGDMISESTDVKLIAAKDGQTDICTFSLELRDDIDPLARCVGNYELTLNANGTATIAADDLDDGSSDNCQISEMTLDKSNFTTDDIGENQVILTVTDTAGNSDQCTTTVTVKENTSAPQYQCVGQFTLPLDENGNASLEISDLYEGNIAASNFSINRSDFSCEDLGQQVVRLSYFENGALKSYCDIDIFVIDNTPPEVKTRDLTIDLDQNGTVSISAEDIDAGSTDNCGGQLSFSLSKSNFNCKNTGSNEVTLTVSDESGNSSSGVASVYVNAAPGICSQQPAPEVKYLYIYPNPNNGHFQIAVPSDLKVKEISLYDNRGRFIGGKSFADDAVDYEVDLSGLQDAIYNLVIQTGRRGKITRRIIVRN
ncbi:MAG: HYR domain-containing protein, partial [Salegentibacter sp.]